MAYELADIITGERFWGLSDMVYSPDIKSITDDWNPLKDTFEIDGLKDGDIIYTHTLYVKFLFDKLRNKKGNYVLITHNSDINIDNTFYIPKCIYKWYAQNVNTLNPKIESIPIGLENSRWFPEREKKKKILQKPNEHKTYRNLVYLNFSIATNPSIRGKIYKMFEDKPWVTSYRGSNATGGFDEYLDNVYNHKFMICPEGNGIDVHQPWECLYVGSIPIERRNINNQFYTDLPICFVDKWSELTEDFLNSEYERITTSKWNMKKISFEY